MAKKEKKRKPKFREGQRVILKKIDPCDDFPDGLPEERGECLGGDVPKNPDWPIMYVVKVRLPPHGKKGHDCSDDGLREVSEDQIREEK
jgi:hypothetical protein